MTDDRYQHSYHVGNVGDVFKHCALLALLAALLREARPLSLIETHAGAGRYTLGPTGEWTAGIGRLWAAPPAGAAAIDRYLASLPGRAARWYPGSPLLARAVLRPSDLATWCELDGDAAALLREHLAGESSAVLVGDGFAALSGLVAQVPAAHELLVVIDPPYTEKSEWRAVVDAVAAVQVARADARVLLWYPIKSYTRPNAMHLALRKAGVAATMVELVTTPLELQRNRLNGSGVVLACPPQAALLELTQALPLLGATCATHEGQWASRFGAWGPGVVDRR